MLEDRGALRRDEREHQATHEDRFLSGWLRDDTEGKAEEMEKLNKEATEEKHSKGKTYGENSEGWLWFANVLGVIYPSSLSWWVVGKGVEEEVVELSGESKNWCEVSVCACFWSVCACSYFAFEHWCARWIFLRFLFLVVKLLNCRLSFCGQSASATLECEWQQKTKASMEAALFQSVPKRTPVKAVPECPKNRELHRRKESHCDKRRGLARPRTRRPRWEKHHGATAPSAVQRNRIWLSMPITPRIRGNGSS